MAASGIKKRMEKMAGRKIADRNCGQKWRTKMADRNGRQNRRTEMADRIGGQK